MASMPRALMPAFASLFSGGKPSKGGTGAADTAEAGELKPDVQLQRVAATVSAGVASRVSALRRQLGRLQQRAREARDARRGAREGRKRGRKRGGLPAFHGKGKSASAAAELVRQAQAHERALDVRSAIRCYEEAAALLPGSCAHLALCSKAWSDATYLDEIPGCFRERLSDVAKREVNERAIAFSRQAMEAGPEASLPHVAACISMGRLALLSENKAKVRLAKEAREHAVQALQKEPESDLAHHLMGRWHWEMAQLNVVVRTLIRLAFGTALPPGSHQAALESYSQASRLAPARLIHRVELGRAYHKLGRRREAWRELEAAMVLDAEDINSFLQKADAEALLRPLRREAARHRWALDPAAQQDGAAAAAAAGAEPQGASRWPQLRMPSLQMPRFLPPQEQEREQRQQPAGAGSGQGAGEAGPDQA